MGFGDLNSFQALHEFELFEDLKGRKANHDDHIESDQDEVKNVPGISEVGCGAEPNHLNDYFSYENVK